MWTVNRVSTGAFQTFPWLPLCAMPRVKQVLASWQPSVVCCEEVSTKPLITTDTNNNYCRLKMITTCACLVLKSVKYIQMDTRWCWWSWWQNSPNSSLFNLHLNSTACTELKIRYSLFNKAYPECVRHLNVPSPQLSSREYTEKRQLCWSSPWVL